MKLIGLAGKARSGKDTVGEYLKKSNFHTYALASPIKKACKEMFVLTKTQMCDEMKEEVILDWGYSPRQMYQMLGTEGGRDLFRQDIWIQRAAIEWKNYYDYIDEVAATDFHFQEPRMAVTDVRFENEAEWVRSEGGVIWHIERPKNKQINSHISESGIKKQPQDVLIMNDGTLEELYKKIDKLL